MQENYPRIGFMQEFGWPAALCTVLALVPHALLRALLLTEPAIFREHPRMIAFSAYAAHSWLWFMVIVTAIIVVASILQHKQLRRLQLTGR